MGGPIAPKCRTCHAEIRFVRMATGKAMPTGLPADPTGIVAARWDGRDFVEGRVLAKGEAAPLGWKNLPSPLGRLREGRTASGPH